MARWESRDYALQRRHLILSLRNGDISFEALNHPGYRGQLALSVGELPTTQELGAAILTIELLIHTLDNMKVLSGWILHHLSAIASTTLSRIPTEDSYGSVS